MVFSLKGDFALESLQQWGGHCMSGRVETIAVEWQDRANNLTNYDTSKETERKKELIDSKK